MFLLSQLVKESALKCYTFFKDIFIIICFTCLSNKFEVKFFSSPRFLMIDSDISGMPLRKQWYVSKHCIASNIMFWTLSTVLFIFQNTTFWKLDSVSVFRLKPTQFGPINRASPCLRRWIMSRNIIFVLMYHHHKLLELCPLENRKST
jgi:hypothetical protein